MHSPQKNETIELKNGNIRILVKKEEAFVYYATFVAGEYNDLQLKPTDLVIDAGANIGDFTIKAAKIVNKGRVIAIEPNPRNLEILHKNIMLNKLNNVEILPRALSNTTGLVSFSGESVSASIMKGDESSPKVQTVTIDEIMKTFYREGGGVVLKMDIEGAEELVFTDPAFLEGVREISMELHGEKNIQSIPTILKKHGFQIKEFGFSHELKNTAFFIVKHPLSFINAEHKSNYTAIRGFLNLFRGTNPVPSVGSNQLKVIYAWRK